MPLANHFVLFCVVLRLLHVSQWLAEPAVSVGRSACMPCSQVSGGEMFEHLTTNGPYSEATAAGFMRELAAALSFLHSNDIIHADLKPENLMLSSWDLGESKLKVRQVFALVLAFGFGFGMVSCQVPRTDQISGRS